MEAEWNAKQLGLELIPSPEDQKVLTNAARLPPGFVQQVDPCKTVCTPTLLKSYGQMPPSWNKILTWVVVRRLQGDPSEKWLDIARRQGMTKDKIVTFIS